MYLYSFLLPDINVHVPHELLYCAASNFITILVDKLLLGTYLLHTNTNRHSQYYTDKRKYFRI